MGVKQVSRRLLDWAKRRLHIDRSGLRFIARLFDRSDVARRTPPDRRALRPMVAIADPGWMGRLRPAPWRAALASASRVELARHQLVEFVQCPFESTELQGRIGWGVQARLGGRVERKVLHQRRSGDALVGLPMGNRCGVF